MLEDDSPGRKGTLLPGGQMGPEGAAPGSGFQPARGTVASSAGQTSTDRSCPPVVTDNPSPPGVFPAEFGRYRILKALGQGAMGVVYLAEDTQLGRKVAIKIPQLGDNRDDMRLERFYREARLAATLRHPNICPVHDVGEFQGTHFISMAYIEGRPLTAALKPDKPIPQRAAASTVRKIALALHEAHSRGVIHRDLKPANIMVDRRGEPIVMDFGLAREVNMFDQAHLTQTGAILGTPMYMSPEQVEGETSAIGPASDIYSLGVILYQLLSGQLPFYGSSTSVMAQILTQSPPNPSTHRADLDPDLEAICLKAMSKKPGERYASMNEFATALADHLRKPKPAGTQPPRMNEEILELTQVTGASEMQSRPALARRLKGRSRMTPWQLRVGLAVGVAALVVLSITIIILDKDGKEIARITVPENGMDTQVEVPVAKIPEIGRIPERRRLERLAAAAGKPLPPELTQVDDSKNSLRKSFRDDLTSEKLNDKTNLIQSLRKRARETEESDLRFALLELAADVAMETASFPLAREICADISEYFYVANTLRLQADLLDRFAGVPNKSPETSGALVEGAMVVGFEALAEDDYETARFLAELAKPAAAKSGADHWQYQVAFLDDEVRLGEPAYRDAMPHLEALRNNPHDPVANAVVGKYLCFFKNNWEHGLPNLIRSHDSIFAPLAKIELTIPVLPEERAALGDAWWNAAGRTQAIDASHCRSRAAYWYTKALEDAVATTAAFQERLLTRIDSVPMRPVVLRIVVENSDFSDLRISNDGSALSLAWFTIPSIMINHIRWSPKKEGDTLPNFGRGRLFPNVVDFSKCQFANYWAGPDGASGLESSPLHVKVRHSHEPGGACNFGYSLKLHPGTMLDSTAFTTRGRNPWNVKVYAWDPKDWDNGDKDIRTVAGWNKVIAQPPLDEFSQAALFFNRQGGRDPLPSAKMPKEYSAMVATSEWDLAPGDYEGVLWSDDGGRVLLDDTLLIDGWTTGVGVRHARFRVTPEKRRFIVRVEHFQAGGPVACHFFIRRVAK
jgi:serine/threonine protein kinase